VKRGEEEDAPLLPDKKLGQAHGQAESFLSGTWLLLVVGSTVFLSMGGSFLHTWALKSQEQVSLKVALGESPMLNLEKAGLTSPEALSVTAQGFLTHSKATVTGRDFPLCNVALPPAELSGSQADTTLAGEQCGEAEAASIAAALRRAGYKFEATVPQPYIFPGYMQQVLWMLRDEHLESALKHLQENAPAGKLGTLVKFFAWGLPVPSTDLEAALDSSAVSALFHCKLLAPCSKMSGMTTSTAMIFPVPNSTLLMVTDWASRSTIGMKEEVVPIISPESMALLYNMPPPKGLNVLDLDSGAGVHGMVAAQRGAASATLFFTSVRAGRFARFSSWLNGLSDVVSVVQGAAVGSSGLQSAFELALAGWSQASNHRVSSFDLLLAQPPFLPVPDDETAVRFPRNGGRDGNKVLKEVLAVAGVFLKPQGVVALVSEFSLPPILSALGCGPMALPGFTGSLIVKQNPLPIQAFAIAHNALASVSSQVRNMQKQGVNAITPGIMFAKRASKDEVSDNADHCGTATLQTLPDPLAWPGLQESKFNRACFLSQETECLELWDM